MKNPDTGILITFEGIDGSGKSTQAREIHNALSLAGLKVRLSREPGATPLGEEIRKILLSDSVPVGNLAELLLFLADRAQHVQDVLRPSRSSGEILLVDRFTDATTAYQGYGMGHPLPLIETLHKTILQDIEPFRTFLLDIDPLAASERIRKRGEKKNRIEERGLEFFRNVRNGYLELAKQNPHRFCVLDATLPREELTRSILKDLEPRLLAHPADRRAGG
ncbi:dTMP kinase [Leptospirillum ferriphilum]|jgi:dTMP kinase|uniref:Thymidylate kinase n=1 Tax=Leptospirillum ferriphilum TaxID=178606 RepID=A0A1V3SUP0_9BACT|nr:dTMP kinase [Leptospirillum ferriphilum]OOH72191.1 dTMP kinase [Leptospirillum ferriphilum]OOH81628.1 dTMP kinase [Leptospirillum ferriphilum]